MSKEKGKSSKFGSLIASMVMCALAALVIYQGPESILTIWINFYNSQAPRFGLPQVHWQNKPDQDNTEHPSSIDPYSPTSTHQTTDEGDTDPQITTAIHQQIQSYQEIFTWKDTSGEIHYTDTAPSEPGATIIKRTRKPIYKKPFIPIIEVIDYRLPIDLKQNIELATLKIFELYSQHLSLSSTKQLQLSIKIFGEIEAFEAYRKIKAPRLENATGFYLGRENEAALWRQHTPEQLLSVLTHEASHAIMHHKIGRAPAWIQEGFAEYMDRMMIYGQTIQIPPDEGRRQRLLEKSKSQRLPTLEDYFSMTDQAFYENNGPDNIHYAMAWSLIYYWMETEIGRNLLHDLLVAHKRFKHTPQTPKVISAYYPDNALGINWLNWLARPRLSHQY